MKSQANHAPRKQTFAQDDPPTAGTLDVETTEHLLPDFTKLDGLLAAVVQDHQSKEVLMVGFMNREALERTLQSGKMHYYSRSRKRLWQKGEQSGHAQRVHRFWVDCDQDAVLFEVEQVGGAACHTGHRSCFYRFSAPGQPTPLRQSEGGRVFDPAKVYRNSGG